jgi:hypothetical protein
MFVQIELLAMAHGSERGALDRIEQLVNLFRSPNA